MNRERALARVCKGTTVIFGEHDEQLVAEFAAAGVKLDGRPKTGTPAQLEPESVRTVVLLDTLPGDDAAAHELIAHAWSAVKPGGRVVSMVPNAKAGNGANARKRRELYKLLEPLGKPVLCSNQPFRWLMMYVKKPRPNQLHVPVTVAERYAIIAELCRGRVIELGCGPGDLAAVIAGRGHDVVGIDISEAKIAKARRRYPGIEFVVDDAAAFTTGACFDTAVLAEVLEHLDEATGARVLQNAVASLCAGGRLIVSVPNEKCIPHPNHIRTFEARTLRRLLQQFGKPTLVTDQPYKWLMMYVDLEQ